MAKTGTNPVAQILQHLGDFYEWRDYPEGGVWDRESGFGYFYHAHPGSAFDGEHGHFHLFWAQEPGQRFNLMALSMDVFGRAIGAFAPNRWHLEIAADAGLSGRYAQFQIDLAYPCFAANQWIGSTVRALAPQLARLHLSALKELERPGIAEDRDRAVIAMSRFDLRAVLAPPPRPSLKSVKR